MKLDQRLVDAAIDQAVKRYPSGYGGAAAIYTTAGSLITSVYLETPNQAANLCHEAGALCEANRRDEQVSAVVCVSRETEHHAFVILPPCGICVERLAVWGRGVEVAVPKVGNASNWLAKTLRDVHPHYWGDVR